jgi:hypothetical protein
LKKIVFSVIASQIEVGRIISHPTGVREQVPKRYLAPRFGRIRKVLRDLVIQTQLPFFDQHHHSRCGELLARRSRLEDRLRLNRHLVLDIRETITAREHDFSVLNNCQ